MSTNVNLCAISLSLSFNIFSTTKKNFNSHDINIRQSLHGPITDTGGSHEFEKPRFLDSRQMKVPYFSIDNARVIYKKGLYS